MSETVEATRRIAPLAELAAGLFWRKEDKVLAIWGYFDESGEHDSKTGRPINMSIGGVYSSLNRWQTLEALWNKVLAREGVDCFHMKDFEYQRLPFDWDEDRRRVVLNDLLNLMTEYIDGFYGYSSACQFDPNRRDDVTDRQMLQDCARAAIKGAVFDAYQQYEEPVNLVFASQNKLSLDRLQEYRDEYDYRRRAIGDITVKSITTTAALQCADIWAYEVGRIQRRDRPERYPFRRLREAAFKRGATFSLRSAPILGA